MELKGKIKLINPTKEYGAKGFKKRELVIETGDDYPQFITVEFIQDKCEVLNSYNVGDVVTIGINIQGREWENPEGETKYFNSIQGWKISKEGGSAPAPVVANESNDLPF
jgi:single-stranded DNA-binding protein|tara:strand:+ start:914 stop:1243 length:330 start_codon:yes stop_codon:yes gene_type:complete